MKDVQMMEVAETFASFGKCSRKKVGAIVVVDGTVVVQGWNGAPRGLRHCNHSMRPCSLDGTGPHDASLCDAKEGDMLNGHCARAVHAEMNCLINAAREGIRVKGGTMFVTVMPCFKCAPAILNAGIERVVFKEAYRPDHDKLTLDLFKEAEVLLDHLDWKSHPDPFPRLTTIVPRPPYKSVLASRETGR